MTSITIKICILCNFFEIAGLSYSNEVNRVIFMSLKIDKALKQKRKAETMVIIISKAIFSPLKFDLQPWVQN
jgi:hypothetical protein